MEKELLLLRKLYTNPELTQRDMAKATGISLGSVNALIKGLVNRGILNVEKITNKALVYNLTSQGLKQKSDLTYRYIVEAYSFLKELSYRLDKLLETIGKDYSYIFLLGNKDEIYELIEKKLIEKGKEFEHIINFEYTRLSKKRKGYLIIVWQSEYIDMIKDIKFSYIDLLDSIKI